MPSRAEFSEVRRRERATEREGVRDILVGSILEAETRVEVLDRLVIPGEAAVVRKNRVVRIEVVAPNHVQLRSKVGRDAPHDREIRLTRAPGLAWRDDAVETRRVPGRAIEIRRERVDRVSLI